MIPFLFFGCNFFSNLFEEKYDPYDHPLIEEGDSLFYQSINDIDSFYISESEVYKPHTKYNNENTAYLGRMCEMNREAESCLCFKIDIGYSYYYLNQYLSAYGIYGGEDNWTFNDIEKGNSGYSYSIGKFELSDLHKISWYFNDEKIFQGKADSVLYSKDYGVVRYYRCGQEYTLSEACLEMLMARE